MSDVIAAAAIAGGVGLAGNVTTYLATRWQAGKTLEATREQSRRELDRVRAEHREGERQHRREIYREFAAILHEFDQWTLGYGSERTPEHFGEWLGRYRTATATVRLVDSPAVLAKLKEITDGGLNRFGRLVLGPSTVAYGERVESAFLEVMDDYRTTRLELLVAMRDDLAIPPP
jgi:hypothetical protein